MDATRLKSELETELKQLSALIIVRTRCATNLRAIQDNDRDLTANLSRIRSLLHTFQREITDSFLHRGEIVRLIGAGRTQEVASLHRLIAPFQELLQSIDNYWLQLQRQLARESNTNDYQNHQSAISTVLGHLSTIFTDRFESTMILLIRSEAPELLRISGVFAEKTSFFSQASYYENGFYVVCDIVASVVAFLTALTKKSSAFSTPLSIDLGDSGPRPIDKYLFSNWLNAKLPLVYIYGEKGVAAKYYEAARRGVQECIDDLGLNIKVQVIGYGGQEVDQLIERTLLEYRGLLNDPCLNDIQGRLKQADADHNYPVHADFLIITKKFNLIRGGKPLPAHGATLPGVSTVSVYAGDSLTLAYYARLAKHEMTHQFGVMDKDDRGGNCSELGCLMTYAAQGNTMCSTCRAQAEAFITQIQARFGVRFRR